MATDAYSLLNLYEGWDEYQISLVEAIALLSREQVAWRPTPQLRSAGEIVSHIIAVRIQWFHHVFAMASAESTAQIAAWQSEQFIQEQPAELVSWLETTWKMIRDTLSVWTVDDLAYTYQLPPYQGKIYTLNRQWIIWHVISHDIHHGGELALVLGMQGIVLPKLGEQGGHLTERAPCLNQCDLT